MSRVCTPSAGVSCLMLWILVPSVTWAQHPNADRTVPIVYSSDLFHPHDDPDDHYDLATLFAIPEFDIRAVLLDLGDRQRLKPGRVPLEQMIRITGRRVPYAAGLSARLRSPEDKALDRPPADQEGVNLLLRALRAADGPVTIFTAGSVRDVCAAFNREPDLLKARVARLYINIGATDGAVEWNVSLDPNAYVGLMRSGLPIYWCPCLPAKVNEHSTYWRFRQSEVLDHLPRPLLSYFVYALQQVRPDELDPIRALNTDLRPWRHFVGSLDRNMWCTAPFLHAAGRQVYARDDGFVSAAVAPAGARPVEVFTFRPARVEIDDRGRTTSVTSTPDGPVRAFAVTNTAVYEKAMTDCLRSLLSSMPAAGGWPGQEACATTTAPP